MRTRHFKDLLVWQRSMGLAKAIYRASAQFPKDEMFGLRSQLRRAGVSVPSNIAEGHGRLSDKSFRFFLAQARGSLYEIETQMMRAADLEFANQQDAAAILRECDEIARMLNSLIRTVSAEANDDSTEPGS